MCAEMVVEFELWCGSFKLVADSFKNVVDLVALDLLFEV